MTSYDITKLIPAILRSQIADGCAPLYRVTKPELDRLPLDTFLIRTMAGTDGWVPLRVARIVQPDQPNNYMAKYRTKAGRLLYVCWRVGMAVRSLEEPRLSDYRHIVLPDDPRHEMIAAFKIGCDHARAAHGRAVKFPGTLLWRALGLDNVDNPFWIDMSAGLTNQR